MHCIVVWFPLVCGHGYRQGEEEHETHQVCPYVERLVVDAKNRQDAIPQRVVGTVSFRDVLVVSQIARHVLEVHEFPSLSARAWQNASVFSGHGTSPGSLRLAFRPCAVHDLSHPPVF